MTTVAEAHGLTPEKLDALGRELDELRATARPSSGPRTSPTSAG